ncbi:MAG TPA: outer membrane protein assembly factor BamD [Candidatus Hydrogenedentes bacterium]|jgi:outer membrane protein assembly factor BamD|nr:MAG: tol-pal system protein YbgF [Candidatus Hydrogenedentes bacterium ADurb.Bin170]HNZ47442.1 outer membrane protein assembly factor BamD [Candidatus Hydrogenedentota bacterium]HOD94692.1 outer membrane protein assembly factor BamD [Candidatus Hydrogenedentota bacterium]HOH41870.1 outer membrane protein assembly factor BamD [Candidatus Hydrogenedentota bacterium]HOM47291.1 outer membrane protein assembly factor BamD [Candidatus Hydrogenedentota bacterium]
MRKAVFFAACALLLTTEAAFAQWSWTPQTGRFINLKKMPKETAELQIEYARSFLVAGNYRKALRECDKFVEYYGNDPLAADNLFLRGEVLMAQRQWWNAAKTFQQLLANYPGSDKYDAAIKMQYELGDRFYARGEALAGKKFRFFKKKPYKRAADIYAMVVENQPFAAEAAEAQYKIGLCHFARKQFQDAAFEYKRVIEDYPTTEWVKDASYGLAMCYYKDSYSPAYDQTPSELTVNAIDDFKANFPGDEKNEKLGEMRIEMRNSIAQHYLNSAKFYERRREFPAAKLYYEKIANEFADTQAVDAAKEWLEKNNGVEHVGDKYSEGIRSAL